MASFAMKAMVLGAFVFAGSSCYAQKGFYAGINMGYQDFTLINTKDQAAGPELDFSLKSNVPIGIGGGYNFNTHMGVAVDIIFSKQTQGYKGKADTPTDAAVYNTQIYTLAKINGIAFSGNYTSDVVLSCIKIPIMFHYTSDNSKKVYFNSFIGPQIDMINAVKFHVNGQEAPLKGTNITPKNVYNSMVMDGVLGLGAGVNLASYLSLTASVRLDYGFGDVEKKSETGMAGTTQFKYYSSTRATTNTASAGLMVSVNYKFVKKAKDAKPAPAAAPAKKK